MNIMTRLHREGRMARTQGTGSHPGDQWMAQQGPQEPKGEATEDPETATGKQIHGPLVIYTIPLPSPFRPPTRSISSKVSLLPHSSLARATRPHLLRKRQFLLSPSLGRILVSVVPTLHRSSPSSTQGRQIRSRTDPGLRDPGILYWLLKNFSIRYDDSCTPVTWQ
jgi:hypothetical protein